MPKTKNIVIAGAGGIGQAVALILTEFSEAPPELFIGNRTLQKAERVVQWLRLGTSKLLKAHPFHLTTDEPTESMRTALEAGDVLLDCLPGHFAPQLARLADAYGLGYANLTEHVRETREIADFARRSESGYILQTGLAPGFINVLAMGLFKRFCEKFKVDQAGYIAMKVGALTRHATAPHYYGFTWSPVGVATEYVQDTACLRDFERVVLPALSEKEAVIINGVPYEADLTSGGAADLPEALAGRVRRLDYKTLRYPGHYDWVRQQLEETPSGRNKVKYLQQTMEARIPQLQDDMVLIYASVEGNDHEGIWQKIEHTYNLHPQPIGRRHILRAIQATTAAPLAQAADLLLTERVKGPVFQSDLDPDTFLNGRFITAVYGKWNGGKVIPGGAQYKV